MTIGIIGGGAAGMAAALAASENENVQVILLERQARVGKKLSATGNGRCNLTNLHANEGGYHGEEASFARFALEKYNVDDTLSWFRSLGLFTVAEESGRVYPYSDQANSVVDVLRFALEKENITLKLGFEAEKVKKTAGGFRVDLPQPIHQRLHTFPFCFFLQFFPATGGGAGGEIVAFDQGVHV